jgi:two-component system, NtrC family, response regulator AtoC
MEQILIVDDDPGFRKLLDAILRGEGYAVTPASNVKEGLEIAAKRRFNLVLSDLKLPDGDGIQVLRWFMANSPETPVIMITAFGTITNAVEAMKIGAADYLGKPLNSPEELRLVVRKTLDQRQAEEERDLLRQENLTFACHTLIAGDPAMHAALELARKVAPTDATVLLTGESGTGKEVLARCIHTNSLRASKAFVAVNCAALSPTLIESELFGHEKGAFTGAVAQHQGRFERAHGGTLFLDEIGELDGNLQAKLLRVLQEKTFERVGGTRTISVDVRVIAATNRNLTEMTAEKKFREDLYYRLSTFPVTIPPLRSRSADIAALAQLFLERYARKLGKTTPRLSETAREKLLAYSWPGNVRELENMMERAAILADDEVQASDLPIADAFDQARPVRMKDMERQAIEEALRLNDGNRTKAAQQLGISLRTLQYRLKEYGINE